MRQMAPTDDVQRPRPICSFYLRRACVHGDSCRFSHPPNLAIIDNRKGTVCSHFLHGKCRFGDRCKDIHPVSVDSSSPLIKPETQPVVPIIPCRFFLQGQCVKGDLCHFIHDPQMKMLKAAEETTKSGNQTEATADTGKGLALRRPCKHFLRGSCSRGESCQFSHDLVDKEKGQIAIKDETAFISATPANSENHDKTSPNGRPQNDDLFEAVHSTAAASPYTYRPIFSCTTKFGAGGGVEEIMTPFESRRVLLSNLPSSVTETDVIALISTFADSASVLVHRSPLFPQPTATVEFPDIVQAALAVPRLDNAVFESKKLAASLDLRARSVETGTGSILSRKVKLNWFTPGRSVVAHYANSQAAEREAQRLDGMMLDDCKLKTFFRARSSTVMVRNISQDTSGERIQEFCGAMSVSFEAINYNYKAPIEMVRSQLEKFGSLESLVSMPLNSGNSKITVFAQFSTAEAAAAAAKAMSTAPQEFLRGKCLYIQHVFSVKYSVRARQFSKVKEDLDALSSTCIKDGSIRYYEKGADGKPADPVTIMLHSADSKAMSRVKFDMEKILRGELLLVDGKNLWDEYFDSAVGQKFIRKINVEAGFFANYDARSRTIRLFGNIKDRSVARELILKQLSDVQARRHILPLQKELVRVLLAGGLNGLQTEMGEDKVVLDIVARTLTVQGEAEDVARVRRTIADLYVSATASVEYAHPETPCPVCFCEVTDPVTVDCGHIYCMACLQHYLRSAAGTSFSLLKCVAETHVEGDTCTSSCNLAIPYSFIRRLLSSAEETSLLEGSFLSYIHARPNEFRYCPTPDCQVIYRPGAKGTLIQCPSCLTRICVACHTESHEGLSCAEYQDTLNGGLDALMRWKSENNIKQCPKCNVDIEKNGGCNHMMCVLCKTHICWVCMKTFGDDDLGGGVYPHMNQAHGL